MIPDIDEVFVSMEAYLLWLFGWVMFCNAHGNACDKLLIPYAQQIADAEEGEVPLWSWGSAVLAATYCGLCQACLKNGESSIFTSCPIFLQIWSDEHFTIDRPVIDVSPYEDEMYGAWEPEDASTMRSMWTGRRVSADVVLSNMLIYCSNMCN